MPHGGGLGTLTDGYVLGITSALVGVIFYILLNWSYTTAVFTDPGSPLSTSTAYTSLPSQESAPHTSLTVKSTGEIRFCKKCHTKKPDRAHHCSTCRRCVLKMDHHCPWLATCVGFRNYKPFILFLVYTCLFCYICFAASATWVWREIANDVEFSERLMPVNYILLAVLAGIIGLVLTGFTGWHIYLACNGQTTIESLEKTRYLAPLRKSMQQQLESRNYVDEDGPSLGDRLREIHANTLPGVTRPEEGEDRSSPAQHSLRQNYSEMERSRERERYEEYLDIRDSEKLPHAFDLGWRRNLKHVFGERPLLWLLPICNTTGDGWQWEASPKWVEANEDLAKEREARLRENQAFERERGWHTGPMVNFRDSPMPYGHPPPPRNTFGKPSAANAVSDDEYASSDDDTPRAKAVHTERTDLPSAPPTGNWNDIPDNLLALPRGGPRGNTSRSRSRGSPSPKTSPKHSVR